MILIFDLDQKISDLIQLWAQAGSAGGVGAAMEARQDPTADGGNPLGPLQWSITAVHVAEVGGALGGALGGAPLGGQSSIMDVQVA